MMGDSQIEKHIQIEEPSPAEHWQAIKEIAKSLENDIKDLQALLDDFKGL